MILHKEYHLLPDGREIKFTIAFNKSLVNWATYEPKKIGYEVNASPVKRTKGDGYNMEESTPFSGFNDNLTEIDRQSKKRLEAAKAVLAERLQKYLDYFTARPERKHHV